VRSIARRRILLLSPPAAPNRGTWNVQFGEKFTISRFTDRLSDSVVVGASRVEGRHSERIDPPLRSGSAILKCPVISERCSCDAPSPECPEVELGDTAAVTAMLDRLHMAASNQNLDLDDTGSSCHRYRYLVEKPSLNVLLSCPSAADSRCFFVVESDVRLRPSCPSEQLMNR
jgi:hypothetical protein